MEHIKKVVSAMSKEALEIAFKDAMARAVDGWEIDNREYAERQEEIARIISDEILSRLM